MSASFPAGFATAEAVRSPTPTPSARARVLVVDDHEDIRDPLTVYLGRQGFDAVAASGASEMRSLLGRQPVDAIVLDIMLSDGDGLALCRDLARTTATPVILLTAMANPRDRVTGLDAGADDYVVKPFDPAELAARIRTVLRRIARVSPQPAVPARCFEFEGWLFDVSARELTDPAGGNVILSETEYRLLTVLVENAGEILSRDRLLDLTQPEDLSVFDRSIDTQVCRLRKKMEQATRAPRFIKTVRGGGYLFTPRVTLKP
jgi:two-component system OmpR family response regulator